MKRIDLNADVGEGFPHDAALFEIVTSANIACGGHAGDDASMRATVRAASAAGVAIGAHPSYPDREHFGRIAMARSADDVYDDVVAQVTRLRDIAAEQGVGVTHVKPHGALYNAASADPQLARAIAAAVCALDPTMALVGLGGGALIDAAHNAGIPAIAEGFADRRYTPEGRLVPRDRCDAFVENVDEALEQSARLADAGIASICVHGDNPQALAFARALRTGLEARGYAVTTPRFE